MARNRNWTREETLKALALYFVLPSGKHDKKNPQVIALAQELGRTPDAVVFKLSNLKAHDPARKPGTVGFTNGSHLDRQVWEELQSGAPIMQEVAEVAATLPANVLSLDPKEPVEFVVDDSASGKEGLIIASTRIGQSYFRNTQLDNYENRCAITGIAEPQLLVASHVRPWASLPDGPDRVAADNGILLNALHDKAFDRGLITIDKDLRVRVSSKVPHNEPNDRYLWSLQGEKLRKPRYAAPRLEFIEWHNDEVFLG